MFLNRPTQVLDQDNHLFLLKRVLFSSNKLFSGITRGEYNSLFTNTGLDYVESTLYSYGDDARHIDWQVSARLSSLYTKRYIDNTNRLVWMIFDCSGSMALGAPKSLYEIGMEALLTLARLSILEKNEVGGVLFANQIIDYIYPSSVYRVLDTLFHTMLKHEYHGGKSNLEEAIRFSYNILSHRSLVIICSDFLLLEHQEFIRKLSRIHDVLLVCTRYNMKNILYRNGIVRVSDSENSPQGIVALSQIRKVVEVEQVKNEKAWKRFSERNHIRWLSIETTDSILSKLFYYLKKRKS